MIGTIEGFRSYASARGVVLPADDVIASQALQRASDYITFEYLPRFQSGYDESSPNVVEAVYEAAIIESRTPNFFSRTYVPGEQKTLVAVGDIRWQVNGRAGSGRAMSPISTRIEQMLSPYLTTSTSSVSNLLRA